MDWLNNLLNIIRTGISQNPGLKLASGVAAIGAVVSLILGILGDPIIAIFGIFFAILFMFILVIFQKIQQTAGMASPIPGLLPFTAWSLTAIMLITVLLFLASFFVCWPAPLGPWCSASGVRISDFKILRFEDVSPKPNEDGLYYNLAINRDLRTEIPSDGVESPNNFRVPIVLTISNFSGSGDEVKLRILLFKRSSGQHAWTQDDFDEITSEHRWWQALTTPKEMMRAGTKAEEIMTQLRNTGVRTPTRSIPVFYMTSCYTASEMRNGWREYMIFVLDERNNTYDRRELRINFRRRSSDSYSERSPRCAEPVG